MSTFGRIHFLRRQRRFALGEFPSPSIGAFEDFESQRLDFGGPERGWAGPGVVYTYAALVAFENYETSTLNSTILPVFGWAAGGVGTPPSFTVQPTASIGAMTGDNIVIFATEINGAAPVTFQWKKNGVNLSNGGVVSGATTTTLTLTGISPSDYGSYTLVATDSLSVTATTSACVLTDIVTDWVTRVVAAGGATPSGGTQTSMTTFANGLVTDSIYSLMKGVCCFVPDNLIASITPLIKGLGNSSWTNHNFVSGDLTGSGLKGNGTTKYLDTGLIPGTIFASDNTGGLTVYAYTGNNAGAIELGCEGSAYNVNSFHMYVTWSDGNTYYDDFGAGTGRLAASNPAWAGYISGNRTASNAFAVYRAKSSLAHSTLVSGAGVSDQTRSTTRSIYCFAANANGSPTGWSNKRLSFAAIHDGLSSGQSSNFYNRIQQLRIDLGGGYLELSSSEAVSDWVARVIANGGATPSGGTQTALAAFYSGLISDGLDTKIKVLNAFVPDSFIAACTPLIAGVGNDLWTNHNFVGGDLSVDGLVGNASNKYLETGAFVSSMFPSATDAGASIYEVSGTAGCAFGAINGPFTSGYMMFPLTSGSTNYEWGFGAGISMNYTPPAHGFHTMSRTSTTSAKTYFANSGNAFAQQVNATTSDSGGPSTITEQVIAFNGDQSRLSWYSNHKISFMAFHTALNATDSQNLFNRVQTLRTALGGGFL